MSERVCEGSKEASDEGGYCRTSKEKQDERERERRVKVQTGEPPGSTNDEEKKQESLEQRSLLLQRERKKERKPRRIGENEKKTKNTEKEMKKSPLTSPVNLVLLSLSLS